MGLKLAGVKLAGSGVQAIIGPLRRAPGRHRSGLIGALVFHRAPQRPWAGHHLSSGRQPQETSMQRRHNTLAAFTRRTLATAMGACA